MINFSDTCKIPPVLWRDELAHEACDAITGAADRPDAAQVGINTIAPGLSNPRIPQLGPTPTTAVNILSCESFRSTYCTKNEKSERIFLRFSDGTPPKCQLGFGSRYWQVAKGCAFFACLRLRDDVVPALADATHVRGDARSGQRRSKQTFGQIPLDLSTEHGRGHGVQDC